MKDEGLSALAAACARCGTCRTVCTLYPERKSETAVARGKVALVEAALAGVDRDDRALMESLLDCLLCGRCERGCPNRVSVEEIVMKGRAALAAEAGLPAWERVLFGRILPSPKAMERAMAAGRAAQRALLSRVPAESGLRYRIPASFGRTLPGIPAGSFTASLGRDEGRRGDVVLFVGCVFDHLLPEVGRASYETLGAEGGGVVVFRDAACCGLPAMASGDVASARRCAGENVRRLAGMGNGPIVFPCGSCLLMFTRNVLHLFPEGDPLRGEAERVGARCVDYASFVLGSGAASRIRAPSRSPGAVGYHDPCHLTGTLGKGREPRALLKLAVGGAFREMDGAALCCGHGGTFNIRDYPTSARLGEKKLALAVRGGTQVVATACSGCLLQLRDMAARTAPGLSILHVAELVSRAESER